MVLFEWFLHLFAVPVTIDSISGIVQIMRPLTLIPSNPWMPAGGSQLWVSDSML